MPTPLRPRIMAGLAAVAARLDRAGIEWLLAGGAGRALRGWDHDPRDLDIEVSAHSAHAAAAALGLELDFESDAVAESWRAIGVVGGVEADLTSELTVRGRRCVLSPDFALQRTWAKTISLAGRTVALAPVEESLARAIVRGDWAAVERVAHGAPPGAGLRSGYVSVRLSAAARAAA